MKKLFCFLFLYIIAILAAIAQQDPQFSFNRLTQLTVNPGYAGSDGIINGTILNRYQWDGIIGSPKTLVFSAGGATELFGLNSGIGLNVISDELGFQKNISVSFDYAYRKKTIFGDLGIGTSLGFYNMSVNGTWTTPESDIHDPLDSDPGVPQSEASQLAFDLGFGIYLRSNDYFIGASVTHINQASILLGESARSFLARHYYLSAGYNISLTDPLFELRPAIYFKTDVASYQADITMDVVYKKRFSAGLNYRINDAVGVLISFELNNGLKVGYAYDIMTSALAGFGNGSHEICLNYSIDLGKNRNKKYKSIRYL
ncbi:MAG: type IX secretion system membrane protein PorP/SprF [Prolixibacteraceae bacterium]